MKGQRGSILAGVVGLTVGITAAIAGFLVVAGNTTRLEADSESDIQLHYAAQSAMVMGLRWLRSYPDPSIPPNGHLGDDNWPAQPIVLNSPGNNDTAITANNYSAMDGAQVKVVFSATPTEFEHHKLRCLATMGSGKDTLEINYYVKSAGATTENENGATLYSLATAQWRETIHPGH
ncbi:MAG: hypothetical protein JF616_11480 [Fibrobacteres bacterium]|nr:hypothetical protein [Fibrobacterota bacterium]